MIVQASKEAEWHPVDRAYIEKHYNEIFSIDPIVFIYGNFEIITSSIWPITLFLCLPEMWIELEVDDIALMIESFESVFSFFFLIEFTGKYLQIDILPMILTSRNVVAHFKEELIEYLKLQWHVLLMTEDTQDSLENDMEGLYLKYNPLRWQEIRRKFLQDSRVQEMKTNFSDFKKYLSTLIGSPLG
ncbi:hypothetical protein [Taibaiella koreensis]|uniref:hypothetical protein n=1 Tax=Taibaiella koreensis TaxID=1268548 RepID=UPI0013C33152|nr:hypothetical protein [Taibaiella koreensis]